MCSLLDVLHGQQQGSMFSFSCRTWNCLFLLLEAYCAALHPSHLHLLSMGPAFTAEKGEKRRPKQQTFLVNTKYLLLPGLYIYILHIQLLLRSICIYMSSLYLVLFPPLFFFAFANCEKDIRSALWHVLFHCVYWPVANCASLSLWHRRC